MDRKEPMKLKEIQEHIKLLEQTEKPIKRLLFSFVRWYCDENRYPPFNTTEEALEEYTRQLKEQEKELLPKQKFKQGELL